MTLIADACIFFNRIYFDLRDKYMEVLEVSLFSIPLQTKRYNYFYKMVHYSLRKAAAYSLHETELNANY